MSDFWFSVLFTAAVAVATLLADFVAGRFVSLTRALARIRREVDQAIAEPEKLASIKQHLDDLKEQNATAVLWGADLVTVALAMDFATLTVYAKTPQLFPFFRSFDGGEAQREVLVWSLLLLIHVALLLLSLILRHMHIDVVAEGRVQAPMFSVPWFGSNRWMFGTNVIGFAALLLSFLAITNSELPF